MRLHKDPWDIKNLGRTAVLEFGHPGNRTPYLRFRVTNQPKRWMPPHNTTIRIEIAYNRWCSLEVNIGGPRYR